MIVKNDPILLRALRGEHTERTPLWLMRQAGRSDPEYRAYRERNPWPLEQLFRDVDAAVEISLLPKRAGVDGIIFFQDILTPLAPMGAPFVFRPGPILEHPIRDAQAIHARNRDAFYRRDLGNTPKDTHQRSSTAGIRRSATDPAVFSD